MTVTEVWVEVAVEGILDEAVARAVLATSGLRVGKVYGRQGKSHLLKRLNGYGQASEFNPWFVLIDLDTDADCAPCFLDDKASAIPATLCLRVAVREIEAWIMADRSPFARFLGVSVANLPVLPDDLEDPKQALVNLARSSDKREIREGVVPTAEGYRSEGPLYTTLLAGFVEGPWSPVEAATRSPSLARCLAAIQRLSSNSGGLV